MLESVLCWDGLPRPEYASYTIALLLAVVLLFALLSRLAASLSLRPGLLTADYS